MGILVRGGNFTKITRILGHRLPAVPLREKKIGFVCVGTVFSHAWTLCNFEIVAFLTKAEFVAYVRA